MTFEECKDHFNRDVQTVLGPGVIWGVGEPGVLVCIRSLHGARWLDPQTVSKLNASSSKTRTTRHVHPKSSPPLVPNRGPNRQVGSPD